MSVASPVIDHLDPVAKYIYLAAGVREYHPIDDIYKEIRNLRKLNPTTHRWYDMPVFAFGAVPKGGGKFTPRYATFNNGWRVVPEDTTHDLYISGEQLTDDGQSGKACLDLTVLSPGTNVFVHYEPPAAELIKAEDELAAIVRMAFDGVVTVDDIKGSSVPHKLLGTPGMPCKHMPEALDIANEQNINAFSILTDEEIGDGLDFTGKTFIGASKTKVTLTLLESANLDDVEFYDATLTGKLDGETEVKNCRIGTITYFAGYIESCELIEGIISLGGGAVANFLDCWTGLGGTPVIDMGGSGQALVMKNLNGSTKIQNKNGPEEVIINLDDGLFIIDLTTVTEGRIVVTGTGNVVDENMNDLAAGWYNNVELVTYLDSKADIVDAIMNYDGS